MAGYVIAIVDVTDVEGYQAYSRQVPATITKYGGCYLVRGGTMEVREGDWPGPRTVILEFPSLAHALKWYDSQEYAPLTATLRYLRDGLVMKCLPIWSSRKRLCLRTSAAGADRCADFG